ncbi:hypothetical protein VTO73DRAFT_2435 [Trametes versicolor]
MMFTLGNLQDIGKFVLVPVSHEDPELTSISQISRSCRALPHTHPSSYEKTAVAHNTPASRVVYERLPLRIEKAGLLGWEAGRGYRDSRRRRYERAAYLVDTNQCLAALAKLHTSTNGKSASARRKNIRKLTSTQIPSPHTQTLAEGSESAACIGRREPGLPPPCTAAIALVRVCVAEHLDASGQGLQGARKQVGWARNASARVGLR